MKCLIVEDSKAIAQIMTKLVRRTSFERYSECDSVSCADSVSNALNLLLEQQFDYVFLDLNLSDDLDGLRVLEYVRQQQKNIPVFIVTGNNNIATVKQVIQLQPTDYLVKPVSKMNISRCLEKAKMAKTLNVAV